jgi:hypothetical protein
MFGTIIDEQGNVVFGQNVQNTEFIAQYINENVKGMTVIDHNYSDTNVKVEITGYMSANMATMNLFKKLHAMMLIFNMTSYNSNLLFNNPSCR